MGHSWSRAAVLMISACGTTPVPSSAAKPVPASQIHAPEFTRAEDGFALVVVTRDKGLKAMACAARLHVDEEGPHLIGVSTEGCVGGADQTEIQVSRAKPVLLRIAAGHGDGVTIEPSAF